MIPVLVMYLTKSPLAPGGDFSTATTGQNAKMSVCPSFKFLSFHPLSMFPYSRSADGPFSKLTKGLLAVLSASR